MTERLTCPKPETRDVSCAARPVGRQPPDCDLAEARVWEALGGGWECLHAGYCEGGVSVEWHDFACAEPRDWARSFHPDSVELCLNLSGHGRVAGGRECALFGRMTAGFYYAGDPGLAAWRLPGERHQFLTIEYSRSFLLQHLRGDQAALHPVLHRALNPGVTGRSEGMGGARRRVGVSPRRLL